MGDDKKIGRKEKKSGRKKVQDKEKNRKKIS